MQVALSRGMLGFLITRTFLFRASVAIFFLLQGSLALASERKHFGHISNFTEHSLGVHGIINGKSVQLEMYPSVGAISTYCSSSLVGPNVVLTAAHCLLKTVNQGNTKVIEHTENTVFERYTSGKEQEISFPVINSPVGLIAFYNDKSYRIKKVIFSNHLSQREYSLEDFVRRDLALLILEEDVEMLKPLRIHQETPRRRDPVVMVGFGNNDLIGRIPEVVIQGPMGKEIRKGGDIKFDGYGRKRVGFNEVSRLNQGIIELEGRSYKKEKSDGLEASGAPGDSGGPLFLSGEIVGVASRIQFDFNGMLFQPKEHEKGFYRSRSMYVDLTSMWSVSFFENVRTHYGDLANF